MQDHTEQHFTYQTYNHVSHMFLADPIAPFARMWDPGQVFTTWLWDADGFNVSQAPSCWSRDSKPSLTECVAKSIPWALRCLGLKQLYEHVMCWNPASGCKSGLFKSRFTSCHRLPDCRLLPPNSSCFGEEFGMPGRKAERHCLQHEMLHLLP
jgi:hypothetical protein